MTLGKLLVFVDEPFWRNGRKISSNRSFILFARSLATGFDRILFMGRIRPEAHEAPFLCAPTPESDFRTIPYYPSIHSICPLLISVLRGLPAAWRAVGESRTVLLGIPNPWALVLYGLCVLQRRPAIFLVRQDLAERVSLRPAGIRRSLALAFVRFLEAICVYLARYTLTFTVGGAMLERYQHKGTKVQPLLISLVRESTLNSRSVRLAPQPGFRKRILWVGRIHRDKGLEDLMDSLAIFPETLRREVELHIVGSGSLEGSLRERASQLGVQAQVHFHGFVPLGPDLEKHYDEAALFVLPSKSEGFPQVILEAMAAGLPVIATHVGGIPSVLKDGSSAILIRPGDPRALASAAEKILTDSSLYERLSAGSLELARRHTLEAERDRMIDSIRAHLGAGMVPG